MRRFRLIEVGRKEAQKAQKKTNDLAGGNRGNGVRVLPWSPLAPFSLVKGLGGFLFFLRRLIPGIDVGRLSCRRRSDDAEIVKNLETAELVLCDMSTLNANVFFELGIRTALNRPLASIKDSLTTEVPFDAGIINYHTYDASIAPWVLPGEIEKLSAHILASSNRSKGKNNLWQYFDLSAPAKPVDPSTTPVEEKLQQILSLLTGENSKQQRMPVGNYGEQVVAYAKNKFGEVNARVKSSEITGDKILIDSEGFLLSDEMVKDARDFAAKLGFKLTVK